MDNFFVVLIRISILTYTFVKFYTLTYMKPDNTEKNEETQGTSEQNAVNYSEVDNTKIIQMFYQTIEDGINRVR